MANITLKDSGYVDIARTKQQAVNDNIGGVTAVNSGTAIELKNIDINYDIGLNFDNTAVVGSLAAPTLTVGSSDSGKITLTGVVDGTNAIDIGYLLYLKYFTKTKGIVLLYYNSTTDGYYDLTEVFGNINKDDVHKTTDFATVSTPHLHVKVVGFKVTQVAAKYLRWQLSLEEL